MRRLYRRRFIVNAQERSGDLVSEDEKDIRLLVAEAYWRGGGGGGSRRWWSVGRVH